MKLKEDLDEKMPIFNYTICSPRLLYSYVSQETMDGCVFMILSLLEPWCQLLSPYLHSGRGKADILGLGQTGSYDRCDIVGYQSLCACVDKYSHVPMSMNMQQT